MEGGDEVDGHGGLHGAEGIEEAHHIFAVALHGAAALPVVHAHEHGDDVGLEGFQDVGVGHVGGAAAEAEIDELPAPLLSYQIRVGFVDGAGGETVRDGVAIGHVSHSGGRGRWLHAGGVIDIHAPEIDRVAVGQDDLVIVKAGGDGGHLYLDEFGGALGRGGLGVKGPRGLGGAIDEVDAVAVACAGGDVEFVEAEQHPDAGGIRAEADARAGIVPAVAFAGDVEHAVKARELDGKRYHTRRPKSCLLSRYELHVHVAGVADAGIICRDDA